MPLQADQRRIKTEYVGEKLDPSTSKQRWWTADDDTMYQHISMVTEDILQNMAVRRRMNYFFAALYNDTGAAFLGSKNINLYYNRTAMDSSTAVNSSITINALQSAIDTASAMISKNKPKPQFITDGAKDYNTKQRGKKLTKFIEGSFDRMKIYQTARKIFLDACIYGTGAIKIFEQDGELQAENLFIEEILIDDLEGMHEKPTQIHQRKFIPRDIIAAQFPKFKDQINGALQVSGGTSTFSTADLIPVIESWHLPSSKKAKDGIHCITIENCTLFSEEYKKDYFPILFFRWARQTLGFFGRGICHETWKLQRELDIIAQTAQRSYRLMSGAVLAVESGSNIMEDHLTSNKLNKIMEFTNTPPSYLLPPMIQPEMYDRELFLIDQIFKISGVSQAQASGTKPPEVKSGVAIREVSDIAQGRFELIGQQWEEFFIDIARMIVDMSADLYKENKNLSVLTKGKSGAERINFKDAITDIENYEIQLFPVSGLPSTPAGRLDQLMDYAQAGYLSKTQVMDIVDFPDLEDTVSLETASMHLVQEILGTIKEGGKYIPPGPYMDLAMAYRMVLLEIDRSQLQHVDDQNIEMLMQWASACKDLLDQSQQQQVQSAAQQPVQGTPIAQQQTNQPLQVQQ